jgi:acetyl esterase
MTIDPAIADLLQQMAQSPSPAPESLSVQANRDAVAGFAPLGGQAPEMTSVTDDVVVTGEHRVPVRRYVPAQVRDPGTSPITVFLHGGGWVTGDLDSQDTMARRIAARSRTIVVSVHYRLAPEHRFPSAIDDVMLVLDHLTREAGHSGGDGSRLALFGESAGGNLAAVAAQEAHRRGLPIVAQALAYPAVDRFDDSPSMTQNATGPLLTRSWMEWFWGCYLNTPTRGATRGSHRCARRT